MKKHINILTLFLLMTTCFYGQENDRKSHEKIKNARISLISNKLLLTTEQAEKFWPIYNNFKNELYALHKQKRNFTSNVNLDTITEDEAKKLVLKIAGINKNIESQKKSFIPIISKILNYKQILKLNQIEHQFKKTLLERIKKED